MPDLSRFQVENLLLEALQSARRRYDAKECSVDVYLKALKAFNDFVINGKVPDDLATTAKSG